MADFEIEEELLKKKYRPLCGLHINLFFPGCGSDQYKSYSTQKHKNVLLLIGVTFILEKF